MDVLQALKFITTVNNVVVRKLQLRSSQSIAAKEFLEVIRAALRPYITPTNLLMSIAREYFVVSDTPMSSHDCELQDKIDFTDVLTLNRNRKQVSPIVVDSRTIEIISQLGLFLY
jgi:hypothetical protein